MLVVSACVAWRGSGRERKWEGCTVGVGEEKVEGETGGESEGEEEPET